METLGQMQLMAQKRETKTKIRGQITQARIDRVAPLCLGLETKVGLLLRSLINKNLPSLMSTQTTRVE